MRRAPSRCARCSAGVLLAGLPAASDPAPAYAEDQVIETALTVDGTPEPDGRPVPLDVTILTTDPGDAPAGRRAGPRLRRHQGRQSAETARTLAQDGYAVIIYTARGFGASGGLIHLDHPDFEGADARRDHRPGGRATRGDQGRGRPGDRVRRGLVRRRAGPAGRRTGPAGGRDRAGVHLEPAEPGAVPAVPGDRRRRVAGRRDAGRRRRGVQAALGVAAVQRRRRAGPRGAGRGPGLRPVHRRAVPGLPRSAAETGRAEPGADRRCWPSPVREPVLADDHRADPDRRRRGRHAVPAGPGRRQPARAAGRARRPG